LAASDGIALVQHRRCRTGIDPAGLSHPRLAVARTTAPRLAKAGIVLAVVRELVAAHGDVTSVDPDRDHGAVFTIRSADDLAACPSDDRPAAARLAGRR
jgi:hypothetical protein